MTINIGMRKGVIYAGIDAGKLAQFHAAGVLSIVTVPDVDFETDRDLLRTRQLSEHRTHIHLPLRRRGIHYKSEDSAA